METVALLSFLGFIFMLIVGTIKPSFFRQINLGSRKKAIMFAILLLVVSIISAPAPKAKSQKTQDVQKIEKPIDTPIPTTITKPTTKPTNRPTISIPANIDQEYLKKASEIIKTHEESLTILGSFLQENPLPMIWTEKELLNVVVHSVIIERSVSDLLNIDHTDKLDKTHDDLVAGFYLHSQAMKDLRDGIDNADSQKLSEASKKLSNGNVLINSASKKIAEIY